jgi:hypothetical protein
MSYGDAASKAQSAANWAGSAAGTGDPKRDAMAWALRDLALAVKALAEQSRRDH